MAEMKGAWTDVARCEGLTKGMKPQLDSIGVLSRALFQLGPIHFLQFPKLLFIDSREFDTRREKVIVNTHH